MDFLHRVLGSLLTVLTVAAMGAELSAQTLNEFCRVTVNGRTVYARPDGSFRIANIPASNDFQRVEVVCRDPNGNVLYGRSLQFTVQDRDRIGIGDIFLTPTPPVAPWSITATPDKTLLGVPDSTQVRVLALYTNATQGDVTPRSAWTTYQSSNPGVATVDPNGVVTAVGAGTVIITARNEGATATTSIKVDPGDPRTTVIGFVQESNGAPVPNATVNVVGQTGTATTDAGGRFEIANVFSRAGPLQLTASATVRGTRLSGNAGPLEPVPAGFTDAGRIPIEATTEGLVLHGGGLFSCVPGTFHTLSIVQPRTATVRTSVNLGAEASDIGATADGSQALITSFCTNELWFYDLLQTPPVRVGTTTLAIVQGGSVSVTDNGFAIVADVRGNAKTVQSINVGTRAVVSTLALTNNVSRVAVTRDGSLGLAGSPSDALLRIVRISPTGVLTDSGIDVATGATASPFNVTISPDGTHAMSSNGDGTVSSFSIQNGVVTRLGVLKVNTLPLHVPYSVQYTPDRTRAYVLLGDIFRFGTREIVVLDIAANGAVTNSGIRIQGIPAGFSSFKEELAMQDGGKRLLVASTNAAIVIDTTSNQIVNQAPVPGTPRGIATRRQ